MKDKTHTIHNGFFPSFVQSRPTVQAPFKTQCQGFE